MIDAGHFYSGNLIVVFVLLLYFIGVILSKMLRIWIIHEFSVVVILSIFTSVNGIGKSDTL